MYMWHLHEANCEWVEAVSYGSAGAMSGETNIWGIVRGD